MGEGVLAWAQSRRADWKRSLKGLQSGVLGTFEVRSGKRVDTTVETIAERAREIAELDALIARHADDDGDPP
jgi:hypothetical protein